MDFDPMDEDRFNAALERDEADDLANDVNFILS